MIAVVGRREADEQTVALRYLGEDGKRQEVISLDEATQRLVADALPPDQRAE